MPSCSTAKNPHGVEIVFTEEDHKYTSVVDGKTIHYTSGTTFLDKYFPKFDPTGEITKRCAKREGLTVEAMKAKWAEKGRKSCIYGTRVHETVEDRLHGVETYRNTPENEKERIVFEYAKKVGAKLLDALNIEGIEKIVFDERLGIAGTIDLLGISKKDGCWIIVDHKTNEKIESENRYNNWCLDPISHLAATTFNHYALQLNLYAYLMKYAGYVDKDVKFKYYLNHLTEKGVKMIELPDLQKEVKLCIDDYLSEKT